RLPEHPVQGEQARVPSGGDHRSGPRLAGTGIDGGEVVRDAGVGVVGVHGVEHPSKLWPLHRQVLLGAAAEDQHVDVLGAGGQCVPGEHLGLGSLRAHLGRVAASEHPHQGHVRILCEGGFYSPSEVAVPCDPDPEGLAHQLSSRAFCCGTGVPPSATYTTPGAGGAVCARVRRCSRTEYATAATQMTATRACTAVRTGVATASRSAWSKVRTFVSTMMPPTAEPSTRGGTSRTSHAATGAATRPPSSRATTHVTSIPAVPRPTRKPRLAATDTRSSLVSIEPTTRRGSIRPLASSAGVPTGPQPPPPVASMKPATSPSGVRKRLRSG